MGLGYVYHYILSFYTDSHCPPPIPRSPDPHLASLMGFTGLIPPLFVIIKQFPRVTRQCVSPQSTLIPFPVMPRTPVFTFSADCQRGIRPRACSWGRGSWFLISHYIGHQGRPLEFTIAVIPGGRERMNVTGGRMNVTSYQRF